MLASLPSPIGAYGWFLNPHKLNSGDPSGAFQFLMLVSWIEPQLPTSYTLVVTVLIVIAFSGITSVYRRSSTKSYLRYLFTWFSIPSPIQFRFEIWTRGTSKIEFARWCSCWTWQFCSSTMFHVKFWWWINLICPVPVPWSFDQVSASPSSRQRDPAVAIRRSTTTWVSKRSASGGGLSI